MAVFRVILVRIFPYSVRIFRTRVIPNTDTFYVVLLYQKEALRGLLKLKRDSVSDILLGIARYFQISYSLEHMLLLENTC